MCPKLIELLSWNGPTVHVCCFMLARVSTKTFVSRVQKQRKIFVSRKIRQQGHSLAEVSLYMFCITFYNVFHIQPEDGHYQAPKHVVVLYAINYIYIYPPDSCVRQQIHSNLVYFLRCNLIEYFDLQNEGTELYHLTGCHISEDLKCHNPFFFLKCAF